MTVDRELVTRKMLLIASDVEALGDLASRPIAAYLASPVDQAVVERNLQRIIGRMIDINYHLITEAGHAPPGDYHASFVRLGELGILEAGFARRIARAAGLRNRLVHEYNGLDAARVFEGLQGAVRDVPEYLQHVQRWLDSAA